MAFVESERTRRARGRQGRFRQGGAPGRGAEWRAAGLPDTFPAAAPCRRPFAPRIRRPSRTPCPAPRRSGQRPCPGPISPKSAGAPLCSPRRRSSRDTRAARSACRRRRGKTSARKARLPQAGTPRPGVFGKARIPLVEKGVAVVVDGGQRDTTPGDKKTPVPVVAVVVVDKGVDDEHVPKAFDDRVPYALELLACPDDPHDVAEALAGLDPTRQTGKDILCCN